MKAKMAKAINGQEDFKNNFICIYVILAKARIQNLFRVHYISLSNQDYYFQSTLFSIFFSNFLIVFLSQ